MTRDRRIRSAARARRPVLVAVLLAVCGTLLWTGAPLAAGKRPHGTPADHAATHAYLEARLAYARAQLASAPASLAALRALQGTLEGECGGVLTGAPHETFSSLGRESEHQTPRQEGEEKRHERQFEALQLELLTALDTAAGAPYHEAAVAFLGAIRPLRWTNPGTTALIQLSAEALEMELNTVVPAVCNDMRAWVQSGYRTISASTKAIERSLEEEIARLIKALRPQATSHLPATPQDLEGPQERRLSRSLSKVEKALLKDALAQARVIKQVEVRLGLKSQAETEEFERPLKGSVEIGHGRTVARTRFKVYVEPPQTEPGPFGATECKHPVTVYAREPGSRSEGDFEISTGSGGGCLSPTHAEVGCERNVITVELRTVAAARRVRLTLSDGRQVTSGVSHIPGKLGGPSGVYYQAVRGPSPTPVRLEELGARGRVLRSITVRLSQRCPPPPQQKPRRRTRTLATGKLPNGGTFAIRGTRTTYEKHTSFHLEAEASTSSEGVPSLGGGLLGLLSGDQLTPGRRGRAFSPELETGCQPAEFAIVYGLLRKSGDVVLARTTTGLVPLRKVKIPKALHAGGVLAYAALPSVPQEVVVQTRKGRKVSATNLQTKARDAREVCEGEAEG